MQNLVNKVLENIKEEREIQKVYQNEMASYLGIVEKTYSKIEKGESHLNLEQFFKICEKLKRSPNHFMGGDITQYFTNCNQSGILNNPVFYNNESNDETINTLKVLVQILQDKINS